MQQQTDRPGARRGGPTPFERNRYFYGKMMDVLQFRMETDYHNAKRWMINHQVFGWGVVCGLDVNRGAEDFDLVVEPGIAFDKAGREIVVPTPWRIAVPQAVVKKADTCCPDEGWAVVQVLLCYHECYADPAPSLAGECESPCEAGAIREGFRVTFSERAAPPVNMRCRVDNLFSEGRLDYETLVQWVTNRGCRPVPADRDACVPLANVYFHFDDGAWRLDHVDIMVRRIVFTNRLISDLIPCITGEAGPAPAPEDE
jgi:hypothetical protein